MSGRAHHFTLGVWECIAVSDGVRAHPWSVVAGSAPMERPGHQASKPQPVPGHQETVPSTCLLVRAGAHCVLIDTGAGPHMPGAGRLLVHLREAGVPPEQIDTVILSHAHPGHAGGALDDGGRPAFPNARYFLWREEWEFWHAEPDLRARGLQWLVAAARASLHPLEPQLELIERDAEIVPGITVLAAPGHTAGHMGLAIGQGRERLMYLADTVFHPAHLAHPTWYSPFDLRPEQSVHSRIRLLNRAVAEQALVHAAHFAFPGLGYVLPRGQVWEWQSIERAPAEPKGAGRDRARVVE